MSSMIHKFRRVSSGCLAAAVAMTSVMSFLTPDIAFAKTEWNGRQQVEYRYREQQDVELSVISENDSFAAGEDVSFRILARNSGDEGIQNGVLKFDNTYLLDNLSLDIKTYDDAENYDMGSAVSEDGRVTGINLLPGAVFEAELTGTVPGSDSDILGDGDITIMADGEVVRDYVTFRFEGETESGEKVSAKKSFTCGANGGVLLPIEFEDDTFAPGAEMRMTAYTVFSADAAIKKEENKGQEAKKEATPSEADSDSETAKDMTAGEQTADTVLDNKEKNATDGNFEPLAEETEGVSAETEIEKDAEPAKSDETQAEEAETDIQEFEESSAVNDAGETEPDKETDQNIENADKAEDINETSAASETLSDELYKEELNKEETKQDIDDEENFAEGGINDENYAPDILHNENYAINDEDAESDEELPDTHERTSNTVTATSSEAGVTETTEGQSPAGTTKATPSDAWLDVVYNPRDIRYELTTYGIRLEDVTARFSPETSGSGYLSTEFTAIIPDDAEPGLYFGTLSMEAGSGENKFTAEQDFFFYIAEEGDIELKGSAPDGGEITVTGPSSAFPDGEVLSLSVKDVPDDIKPQVEAAMEKMAEESGVSINRMRALDIKVIADGKEAELPGGENVTVRFSGVELQQMEADQTDADTEDAAQVSMVSYMPAMDGPEIFDESAVTETAEPADEPEAQGSQLSIWHFDNETGEVEEMPSETDESGSLAMTTTHFSIYIIVDAGANGQITVTVQHWANISMLDGVDGSDGLVVSNTGKLNGKRWDGQASLRTKNSFTEIYSPDTIHLKTGYENDLTNLSKIVLSNKDKAAKNYTLLEIWVLKNGKSASSTDKQDWDVYTLDEINSSSKTELELSSDKVVRMVYSPVSTTNALEQDVTFFDYNVGDGNTYNSSGTKNSTGKYIKTESAGINSSKNFTGGNTTNRLAVGMSSTPVFHTYGSAKLGSLSLNTSNKIDGVSGAPAKGFVKGVDDDGPIYNGIYDAGLFNKTPKTGKYVTDDGEYKLVFNQLGDTYTMTKVTRNGVDQLTNLHTLQEVYDNKSKQIFSNNFFPLDKLTYSGRDPLLGAASGGYYGMKNNNTGAKQFGASDDDAAHNWFFGMRYDFEFTIGDYKGPIYYYFRGDDDFWLFVDGKLRADIGGIHSSYGAMVDLNDLKNEDKLKKHKVTIIFAERGGFGSCCYIQYTMPNLASISLDSTVDNTTSITVNKTWNHGAGIPAEVPASYRPSEVTVTLEYEDKSASWDDWSEYETATLTSANGWTKKWTELPMIYKYRVVEKGVSNGSLNLMPDYTVTGNEQIIEPDKESYTVTIDNTLNTTSVEAIKRWEDENNRDGVRPDSVVFKLQYSVNGSSYSDFSPIVTKTLTSANRDGSDNQWSVTFDKVPDTLGGAKVQYRVMEMDGSSTLANGGLLHGKTGVIDATDNSGYTATYESNLTVVNTHTPVKTSQTVRKDWLDVPSGIDKTAQAALFLNGTEVEDTREILNEGNRWNHTWYDLYKYQNNEGVISKNIYEVYEIDKSGSAIKAGTDGKDAVIGNYMYHVTSSSSGTVTTILNRLITAKLRVVKRIDNEESLPNEAPGTSEAKYKFLINVSEIDGGTSTPAASMALADRENPDYVIEVIPDVINGKVLSVKETVPMEYSLTAMYGNPTKDWTINTESTTLEEGESKTDPKGFYYDKKEKSAFVTLMPGDDVTVTVINTPSHQGYMHKAASVTNRSSGSGTYAANYTSVKTAYSGFMRIDDYQELPLGAENKKKSPAEALYIPMEGIIKAIDSDSEEEYPDYL